MIASHAAAVYQDDRVPPQKWLHGGKNKRTPGQRSNYVLHIQQECLLIISLKAQDGLLLLHLRAHMVLRS